jgi:hypothetical protein
MKHMRTALSSILVLILLAPGLSCFGGNTYQLHIDDTYFSPHRSLAMVGWGQNIPNLMENNAELRYQGIYVEEPYGRVGLVRRFARRKGWSYVILTDTLSVAEDTLVEVWGTVASQKPALQVAGKRGTGKRLEVENYRVLYDTRPLRERAQREYLKIREDLQKQVSLPGSRLQLGPDPDWRADWCHEERAIIVAAHFYDLMYAAEAQFLFTMDEQKLVAVYFHEWFKGE